MERQRLTVFESGGVENARTPRVEGQIGPVVRILAASKKSSSRPIKLSFKWGMVVALVRDQGREAILGCVKQCLAQSNKSHIAQSPNGRVESALPRFRRRSINYLDAEVDRGTVAQRLPTYGGPPCPRRSASAKAGSGKVKVSRGA